MYHAHFKGTHYEAGFRWGSLLLEHKNIILNNIPFPVTRERVAFGAACVPIYKRYYPEILEEIQGLADGQRCDARILQGVLLGMYAIPPACGCSCFAAVTKDEVFLGRNSDFLPRLKKQNQNVIYQLAGGAYTFTGNTTAFVEMEDGVNEHGLAVGLASVYPWGRAPGLNAGLLLRYFLEKCRTVEEALSCVKRLPIASAQTFVLADVTGTIAAIECSAQKVQSAGPFRGKRAFVCGVNAFQLPEMQEYTVLGCDDWFSKIRYTTMVSALSSRDLTLPTGKSLLSGELGFLCQYDRKTGKDTVWSVLYDLKRSKIYRCEGNPSRSPFREDRRFPFGKSSP